MKLLYITNGITGSGGLERVLSLKASLLSETLGYEVHILSLNEEGKTPFFNFSDQIIRHSILVGGNPLMYLGQYVSGIRQKVKEINPNFISVCDDGLKGFFLPRILGNKIPVIYERHASAVLNGSALQHRIMRYLAKDFHRFVILTKGGIQEWPGKNTMVIPNPISFYPEHSSVLNSKKVIAVGSHSYNKGYDLLLKIWQKVETDFPDWQLDIYGKYKEDTFQNLAKTLNLKKVYFHPPVSKIEEKYLESSVFVLPSRSEGFGMVIIEAMSCGLPVVSFDCPHGPADIITHAKNGFLIKNGNTDKFAARLQQLMSDGELRQRVGSAGRENVKKYLPETVVKEWDVLFRSLVKKEK